MHSISTSLGRSLDPNDFCDVVCSSLDRVHRVAFTYACFSRPTLVAAWKDSAEDSFVLGNLFPAVRFILRARFAIVLHLFVFEWIVSLHQSNSTMNYARWSSMAQSVRVPLSFEKKCSAIQPLQFDEGCFLNLLKSCTFTFLKSFRKVGKENSSTREKLYRNIYKEYYAYVNVIGVDEICPNGLYI